MTFGLEYRDKRGEPYLTSGQLGMALLCKVKLRVNDPTGTYPYGLDTTPGALPNITLWRESWVTLHDKVTLFFEKYRIDPNTCVFLCKAPSQETLMQVYLGRVSFDPSSTNHYRLSVYFPLAGWLVNGSYIECYIFGIPTMDFIRDTLPQHGLVSYDYSGRPIYHSALQPLICNTQVGYMETFLTNSRAYTGRVDRPDYFSGVHQPFSSGDDFRYSYLRNVSLDLFNFPGVVRTIEIYGPGDTDASYVGFGWKFYPGAKSYNPSAKADGFRYGQDFGNAPTRSKAWPHCHVPMLYGASELYQNPPFSFVIDAYG